VRRFLTLDLETIPDETLVSAVDGEPSRPYDEQLSRLLAARRAQSGGRSDFLPLPYHRPVAACWIEAEEIGALLRVVDLGRWTDEAGGEQAFLARAWERLERSTLVTFHGRGFDLPVLELRSLKLGVPAPAHFAAGRSLAHVDLYEVLSKGGASPAPLDLYAKLVGLPGKEDTAGKDVQRLYAQRAHDRIAAYCMTDVAQTWLLFLRWRLLEGTLSPQGYAQSVASVRERLPALFAERLRPQERALLEGFLERCEPFFAEAAATPPLRRAL
jgi:predicted PolB exonuclease-like 3'-5' exonuclease